MTETNDSNTPEEQGEEEVSHGHGDVTEGERRSIHVRFVRHAESRNNQVYRDARFLFRGGTPSFDKDGWINYVNTHRSHDPTLSEVGRRQRDKLADFLVPHLINQASEPVRVIVSPMRRTLETIQPTLQRLHEAGHAAEVIVNAYYHESEGCHDKDRALDGMTPDEIRKDVMKDVGDNMSFEGFPSPTRGWYVGRHRAETRQESEERASKFYLWLCEYLDQQLACPDASDIFDAGVQIQGEEEEHEHDKFSQRFRRRRMTVCVGHGDFMSLVLKRIIAGFGHCIEFEGTAHRSAFIHYNTGITEVEYFGQGRFLIMGHNQTPHLLDPTSYRDLRTGGSLKDGWTYLMPTDELLQDNQVVAMHFDDDEQVDDFVKEQTQAMKALYLGSSTSRTTNNTTQTSHSPSPTAVSNLCVEEDDDDGELVDARRKKKVSFFVKRGQQVVGCATYDEVTGHLSQVVVRPSVAQNTQVGDALLGAVRKHARKVGRSDSLYYYCDDDVANNNNNNSNGSTKSFLEQMGFQEVVDETDGVSPDDDDDEARPQKRGSIHRLDL